MGFVMTRISEKTWNSVVGKFRMAALEGIIDKEIIDNPDKRPTHILDIYKMRRGRYKNVRIWISLHLGTGYRKDLIMTTADNQPIDRIDKFNTTVPIQISNWAEEIK